MPPESQIPIASAHAPRRFAARLALFYGAVFSLIGSHLPFFPMWLKAVGIDASWIGIITAVPAVTRFTVLPFVTSVAEGRASLRGAMIVTAFMTALGFSAVGTQHQPMLVFLAFAVTASMWTPMWSARRHTAFSSEVETGSREENASKKGHLGSDFIRT